jgi:Na+-transporting methylmalonyl-CoA/oxaloacetate decarboxylase beta subunit
MPVILLLLGLYVPMSVVVGMLAVGELCREEEK